MITFLSLSERICQFFDSIYKTNKSSFGFSSVGDESFREERINQDIRPSYDFSSTDFISSDLDLSKWKTILVGSRTIDIYIRGVLGKTILQIPGDSDHSRPGLSLPCGLKCNPPRLRDILPEGS